MTKNEILQRASLRKFMMGKLGFYFIRLTDLAEVSDYSFVYISNLVKADNKVSIKRIKEFKENEFSKLLAKYAEKRLNDPVVRFDERKVFEHLFKYHK